MLDKNKLSEFKNLKDYPHVYYKETPYAYNKTLLFVDFKNKIIGLGKKHENKIVSYFPIENDFTEVRLNKLYEAIFNKPIEYKNKWLVGCVVEDSDIAVVVTELNDEFFDAVIIDGDDIGEHYTFNRSDFKYSAPNPQAYFNKSAEVDGMSSEQTNFTWNTEPVDSSEPSDELNSISEKKIRINSKKDLNAIVKQLISMGCTISEIAAFSVPVGLSIDAKLKIRFFYTTDEYKHCNLPEIIAYEATKYPSGEKLLQFIKAPF